jgi:hypothetical protein
LYPCVLKDVILCISLCSSAYVCLVFSYCPRSLFLKEEYFSANEGIKIQNDNDLLIDVLFSLVELFKFVANDELSMENGKVW